MNPNDILAQQQAYLNQVMQHTQQVQGLYLLVGVVALVLHFGIIYLFYARLRDIAQEMMKLRIAFEMAEGRKPQPPGPTPNPADRSFDQNPFSSQ